MVNGHPKEKSKGHSGKGNLGSTFRRYFHAPDILSVAVSPPDLKIVKVQRGIPVPGGPEPKRNIDFIH